jgi:hypothetical protein
MLKHTLLVLLVTASLLMAVGAVASAEGEVGGSGGEFGVGPTQLLADGTLESDLA